MRKEKGVVLLTWNPLWRIPTQVFSNQPELLQRRLQIFDDFLRNHIGRRQVVRVSKAFIFEPKNVEARLVSRNQLIIAVSAPTTVGVCLALRRAPLVAVGRVVERHKLIEVFALERVGLKREVLIGA
jgi:hypothetical protein